MCITTSLVWCTLILSNPQVVLLVGQFYFHQHEKLSKDGIYMLQSATDIKKENDIEVIVFHYCQKSFT